MKSKSITSKSSTEMTTPVVSAYAVLPSREDEYTIASETTSTFPGATTTVELDRPNRRHYVTGQYANIPEARHLSWEDDYFDDDDDDDDDDIIAVFDFDYEQMEVYYSKIGWCAYGATCFFPTFFWIATLLGTPCYLHHNVNWAVRCQHIAITKDGIRFVKERRRTFWGSPCTDAGRTTKTIPFDKITDCDIVEPAGNTCICIENTLYNVNIDTASGSPGKAHELSINGLKDPIAFKKLVWAMKRNNNTNVASAATVTGIPESLGMLERGLPTTTVAAAAAANGNNSENVAALLRDIRDELRQHNQALQALQQNTSATTTAATAPPESEDSK